MAALPTGTVTFVFTDIEGSTTMLQRLGQEPFGAVIEEHQRLIREAFSPGVEVRPEGDAFFFAFAEAGDALRAAIRAQQMLAAHDWPAGGTVRVRMGMHTGQGSLGGGDYVGIDVHRAARIAAAGHGEQILITDATRALSGGPPNGASLRDLGTHRFKDLAEPEHLFDVVAPGLAADHPPIRSLDARPNNLPAQPSEFVGRQAERTEVDDLIERSRLVTLTGPGGTGKTRLALRVAQDVLGRFDDGVVYVPLDGIREARLVGSAIATALGANEVEGRPAIETAASYLSDRNVLLVMDNFEHVLPAAEDVGLLLMRAPGVRILVTSQAQLRLRGEHVYLVPPLAPAEGAELLVRRVEAAVPGLQLDSDERATVDELVARLEGLPLALELAAANVQLFGLTGLVSRLDRLREIESGLVDHPDRHRTLTAAIRWSYDLLDEDEQRVLRHLGIFDGGFTLDAAEEIAGEDAIPAVGSLVEKSLLRSTVDRGEVRFAILDSIRRFSLAALDEAEGREAAANSHAGYFADLSVRARPLLEGENQRVWLDRLADEHDNMRAALRHSLETGQPGAGLRVAGAAWRYFHRRGHLPEAREWLTRLLAIPGAGVGARAEGLNGLAAIVYWQGAYERALELYEEVLPLFESLDESARVADTYFALSATWFFLGDLERGALYGEKARAAYEAAGSDDGLRRAVAADAFFFWRAGRFDEALVQWKEVHRLYGAAGDTGEQLQSRMAMAAIAHQQHRSSDAVAGMRSVLDDMVERADVSGTVMALEFVAAILAESHPEQAVRLAGAATTLRKDLGGGLTPESVGLPGAREAASDSESQATLDAAWAEGTSMNRTEAVAHARSLLEAAC